MRHTIILLVLLAGSGCTLFTHQASPEQRWAGAATLYTSTLNSLTALKTAGVLDDEDKANIEPYRLAARAALNSMETSIALGSGDFETYWKAFSEAIDEMLKMKAHGMIQPGGDV